MQRLANPWRSLGSPVVSEEKRETLKERKQFAQLEMACCRLSNIYEAQRLLRELHASVHQQLLEFIEEAQGEEVLAASSASFLRVAQQVQSERTEADEASHKKEGNLESVAGDAPLGQVSLSTFPTSPRDLLLLNINWFLFGEKRLVCYGEEDV